MNEQEAQKAAFKKWDDLNKNSLSIDHKSGHEQGWDDCLEWVKQGQEPFPKCVVYTDKYGEKQLITGMYKGEEDRYGQRLYLHPAPPPDVSELVEILKGFASIINESDGVSGYHLNGAVADWDEFDEVNQLFESLAKWEAKK